MTQLGRPNVIPDIVEEHFEELDFLWEQREGVVFAPDWTLEDLAELEERAEAHLDGLRLAELHAVDLARPFLAGDETFAATAATLVLMETGAQSFADEVVAALEAAGTPEARDGIRIGLRHARIDAVRERLVRLAGRDDPALAAAAADVLAFHRVGVDGVERLLDAEDPAVRVLALGALGRLGRLREPERLRTLLADDAERVRRAALGAAAASGLPDLETLCREAALDREAPVLEAMRFLGVFGNPVDLPLLEAAAADEECGAVAIEALGALGRVQAIPVLIERMEEGEAHVRAAAAAYARITAFADLGGERPAGEGVSDAADEEDEEDDAPPPDPDRARAWWAGNAERFPEEARWKDGIDVSEMPAPRLDSPLSLASWRELAWARSAAEEGPVPAADPEGRVRDRA